MASRSLWPHAPGSRQWVHMTPGAAGGIVKTVEQRGGRKRQRQPSTSPPAKRHRSPATLSEPISRVIVDLHTPLSPAVCDSAPTPQSPQSPQRTRAVSPPVARVWVSESTLPVDIESLPLSPGASDSASTPQPPPRAVAPIVPSSESTLPVDIESLPLSPGASDSASTPQPPRAVAPSATLSEPISRVIVDLHTPLSRQASHRPPSIPCESASPALPRTVDAAREQDPIALGQLRSLLQGDEVTLAAVEHALGAERYRLLFSGLMLDASPSTATSTTVDSDCPPPSLERSPTSRLPLATTDAEAAEVLVRMATDAARISLASASELTRRIAFSAILAGLGYQAYSSVFLYGSAQYITDYAFRKLQQEAWTAIENLTRRELTLSAERARDARPNSSVIAAFDARWSARRDAHCCTVVCFNVLDRRILDFESLMRSGSSKNTTCEARQLEAEGIARICERLKAEGVTITDMLHDGDNSGHKQVVFYFGNVTERTCLNHYIKNARYDSAIASSLPLMYNVILIPQSHSCVELDCRVYSST